MRYLLHPVIFLVICSITSAENTRRCGEDGYHFINIWAVEMHGETEITEIIEISANLGFIHHRQVSEFFINHLLNFLLVKNTTGLNSRKDLFVARS